MKALSLTQTKLKVGVVLDNDTLPFVMQQWLDQYLDHTAYTVTHLIVIDNQNDHTHSKQKPIPWLLAGLLKLEQRLLKRYGSFEHLFAPLRPTELPIKTLWVKRVENVRHTLDNVQWDVLVDFTREPLPDGYFSVARLGVLSVAFNYQNDTTMLPGFWEVYLAQDSSEFAIMQQTPEQKQRRVLCHGKMDTGFFYAFNSARLQTKTAAFLHQALCQWQQNPALAQRQPTLSASVEADFVAHPAPSVAQQFAYGIRLIKTFAHKVISTLTKTDHRWSVAYLYTPNWQDAKLSCATVIINPPGHFYADPFTLKREGRQVVFVEDYVYAEGKAVISAIEILSETNYQFLGVVLEESFHLSYPYLFEVDGELYMCPECNQSGDIRLYKCLDFPLRWSLHKVLMSDVQAVDTNLFYHQDRWWMTTNICSAGVNDFCSELHIFHAECFDADDWTPHAHNPVLFDPQQARNGGFIYDQQGELYRAFQRQRFALYGAGGGVAKVKALTADQYQEQVMFTLAPDFKSGIEGVHTFSFDGEVLVVDFLRRERWNKASPA